MSLPRLYARVARLEVQSVRVLERSGTSGAPHASAVPAPLDTQGQSIK